MATKIRGITVELGADTSGIEKGLKDVNKDLKATQNELKDVEKLLKLDPKNTELLAQKQKLLAQQLEQTKDKLKTLKEAEKAAEEQFKNGKISEEQYRAIKREVAATEGELDKLGGTAQTANRKLASVPDAMNKISSAAKTAAQKTRGLSLAAAGLLTALGAGVYKSIQNADTLNTQAKQSGISTERLQEYNYAADLIDVSTDSIIAAQKKLKKNMTSSSTSTTAAFDKLGVKVTDANGELRDSSEVFDEVVLALSKVTNETERDTLAMELFGKGADELAGLIDDGGAAFRKLAKEAHEVGAVLSQDSLDALNKTNDALDKLKNKASAALGQIADKLINNPNTDKFLDKVVEVADGLVTALAEMDTDKLMTLVGVLAGTAAVSPLATLIGNVAGAIGKVTAAIGTASGAGGLATAIGGAGGLTAALTALAVPLATIAAAEGLKLHAGGDTFDQERYKEAEEAAEKVKIATGIDVDPMVIYDSDVSPDQFINQIQGLEDAVKNDPQAALFPRYSTIPGAFNSVINGTPNTNGGDEIVVNVTYNGDAAAVGQALEPTITAERVRRGYTVVDNPRNLTTW